MCVSSSRKKGRERRTAQLVYSSCTVTRTVRLASNRPNRKLCVNTVSIPSHRRTVRLRALEPLRTLLSNIDRAASAVAGVRAGSRRLSVPSVEIEICGSTAQRRNRRERECEIDANARRNEVCVASTCQTRQQSIAFDQGKGKRCNVWRSVGGGRRSYSRRMRTYRSRSLIP
jgi:hypothetical protein